MMFCIVMCCAAACSGFGKTPGVSLRPCACAASAAAAAAAAAAAYVQQDNDVQLEAIKTFKDMRPKEISRMTSQLLFPLNVKGDRQYYFNNIHESDIFEREVRD
jgi:hypothetical protein